MEGAERKKKREKLSSMRKPETQKETARNQRDEHEPDGEKTGRETSWPTEGTCRWSWHVWIEGQNHSVFVLETTASYFPIHVYLQALHALYFLCSFPILRPDYSSKQYYIRFLWLAMLLHSSSGYSFDTFIEYNTASQTGYMRLVQAG